MAACSDDGPDPDAVKLQQLSRHAVTRARSVTADAVLRQVDLAGAGDRVSFRLTDLGLTQVLILTADGLDSSAEELSIAVNDVSPLLSDPHSGISLRSLTVGPAAVVRAATDHWRDCEPRSLSLAGEDDDLVWHVFCNLPEGVVSGTVDPVTGDFTPSGAPPAVPPPTASPGSQ